MPTAQATALSETRVNSAGHPLDEAALAAYALEGYLVVRGLANAQTCREVVKACQQGPDPTKGRKEWESKVFDHAAPDVDLPEHRLLVDPQIVAAVEQIFEGHARIWYGMLAMVPAHGGRGLPWHQDNQYDFIVGQALNVFIACCDITPDKANLWMAPRSHLNGLQSDYKRDHNNHWESADPANGFCLPTLRTGDVCIFNRFTMHRSLTNQTAETRYAYGAQYMVDAARIPKFSGAKDPLRMRARDLASRPAWRKFSDP